MEGLQYKQIAERENLSELALNLRYTLNATRVNASKLKLDKQRNKVKRTYQNKQNLTNASNDFAERVAKLNLHFKNL
ncbi:hypothetical protein [Streptococcus halichoeri]|uniref:hypothetical protein n=1 Tax=Streptococcus halichoeri TaxID=254785 RepID=UPI00135B6A54|nr:hypothetical protein [Streptococcus halichoeri]